MKNLLKSALFCSALSFSAQAGLSEVCQNLGDDDTFYSIFERQGKGYKCISHFQQEIAIKAAVQWYADETNGFEKFEQYNELAEGLQCTTVLFEGKLYDSVSVGFGGGNAAQYLFNEKGEILSPMFIDGYDCFDNIDEQGNAL